MELGNGTYCYMWSLAEGRLDAHGLLQRATELGVERVQFGLNHPLEPGRAREVIRDAQERGLTIEIGMAGLELEEIRRNLDLCREAGSPLLRTVLAVAADEAPPVVWIELRLRRRCPCSKTPVFRWLWTTP